VTKLDQTTDIDVITREVALYRTSASCILIFQNLIWNWIDFPKFQNAICKSTW